MGTYRVKKLIIVTGMSGSGKSSVIHTLEDQGLFAVDNIPAALLPQLLQLLETHEFAVTNGVVAVVDVRSRDLLRDFVSVTNPLREEMDDLSIVFLDASDETLIQRFNTTRRSHPLGDHLSVSEGIRMERELLSPIREKADKVIDTTGLTIQSFRSTILDRIGASKPDLTVIISSFGFKHGIPQDSDYVLDVRFLPNPYYTPLLKGKTGLDKEVQDYIKFHFPDLDRFLEVTQNFFEYLIPRYVRVGKGNIHIAIGCTGGRHRSVAVAEWIKLKLSKNSSSVITLHRDIENS